MADDLVDGSQFTVTCTPVPKGTTLPVGGQTTCQGSYLVSQADLNRGTPLVNTATASFTNASPLSASATTRVQQNPRLTVVKTGDKTQVVRAGEVISYTIDIVNRGNIDLTALNVVDPLIDGNNNNLICFPVARGATLTVAQPTTRCTGTYTVPQSVMDAGSDIVNSVTVTTVQTQPVVATFNTRVVQQALVTVVKSADRPTVANEGDVIQYTIVVSNVGTVTLTSLQILDPLVDNNSNDITCTPVSRTAGVLLVNQTTRCTGTFVTPQSTINVGGVVRNTVTVTSAQGASASAFVETPILQRPALEVTKTADRLTVNTAGQVILYEITVRNVGNVNLDVLQVTDPLIDSTTNDLVCSPFARGQTLPTDSGLTVCRGSFIVTQGLLDAGGIIKNTVTVSTVQTNAVSAEANTVVAQNPRLVVSKVADPSSVSVVGSTITYRINVLNAGNVRGTQLLVVDNKVDAGLVTCAPVVQGGTLDVGQATVCTGSKVVTQALLDAAVPIQNTASVSTQQSVAVPAQATVFVGQTTLLTLTKRASVGQVDRAGQTVSYTIEAANVGTVTLNNFQITDPLLQNNLQCSPVGLGANLAVGQSTTCVGSLVVTQAMMNLGVNIVNVATVQTTQFGPVMAMDVTSITQNPSFTVNKTASPSIVTKAGQIVTFSIAVINTGNVDLTNVQVTDRLIEVVGDKNLRCTPIAEGATLTVGSSMTCVGTYTTTQADVNTGLDIVNFASVNTDQFGPVSARATVTVQPSLSLVASKRANLESVSFLGQRITWSLTITNTGSSDLPNLRVVDPLIQNNVNDLKCTPVAIGSTLTVSSPTTTCVGTSIVSQQDLNTLTAIINTAQISATGLTSAVTVSASVRVVQNPSFSLTKEADRISVDEAGQVILYTLIIRNLGNVDLPGFQLSDPLVDGGRNNMACRPVPKGGVLTVANGLINCTGSHVLTQDQMNAGAAIQNTAVVSFTGWPTLSPVSANVSTFVLREPSLTVTKEADRFSANAAGQVINYEIIVTNTGNVDLVGLSIADPLVGGSSGLTCSPPLSSTLTVDNPLMRCSARYVTTQANIDAGTNIVNTVTVSATNLPAPVSASAVTFLTQTALLTISKTADKSTVSQVGEVVGYTIVVRNIGNVGQTGVAVTDSLIPSLSCSGSGALAIGASLTCTGSYTVTAANINAGTPIVNVATVRSAQVVQPVTASVSVNVFRFAQFTAVKSANTTSVSAVGSTIAFTVDIVNTGTVALTPLTVTDALLSSPLVCAPTAQQGTLARGSSTRCTGLYRVTQDDLNRGTPIRNDAFVTFGNAGTVIATATVGVNSVTAFTVSKTASPTVVTGGAGSNVVYSVVVQNTGSSDLTGFQINDPLFPGGMTCTPVQPGGTLLRGGFDHVLGHPLSDGCRGGCGPHCQRCDGDTWRSSADSFGGGDDSGSRAGIADVGQDGQPAVCDGGRPDDHICADCAQHRHTESAERCDFRPVVAVVVVSACAQRSGAGSWYLYQLHGLGGGVAGADQRRRQHCEQCPGDGHWRNSGHSHGHCGGGTDGDEHFDFDCLDVLNVLDHVGYFGYHDDVHFPLLLRRRRRAARRLCSSPRRARL